MLASGLYILYIRPIWEVRAGLPWSAYLGDREVSGRQQFSHRQQGCNYHNSRPGAEGLSDSDCTTAFISPGYASSPWCSFEWWETIRLDEEVATKDRTRLRPIVWKEVSARRLGRDLGPTFLYRYDNQHATKFVDSPSEVQRVCLQNVQSVTPMAFIF